MELSEEEKAAAGNFMSYYFSGSRNREESGLSGSPEYYESLVIRNLPVGLKLRRLPEEQKTEAVCLAAVQKPCERVERVLEYVPWNLRTAELCFEAFKRKSLVQDKDGYFGHLTDTMVPKEVSDEFWRKLNAYRKEHWE